eukprot:gene20160-22910_t
MTHRRSLLQRKARESAVKAMILVKSALFMIVDIVEATGAGSLRSVCIAKVDIGTGLIIQQVQIESFQVGITCTDVATSSVPTERNDLFLYITCSAIGVQKIPKCNVES